MFNHIHLISNTIKKTRLQTTLHLKSSKKKEKQKQRNEHISLISQNNNVRNNPKQLKFLKSYRQDTTTITLLEDTWDHTPLLITFLICLHT